MPRRACVRRILCLSETRQRRISFASNRLNFALQIFKPRGDFEPRGWIQRTFDGRAERRRSNFERRHQIEAGVMMGRSSTCGSKALAAGVPADTACETLACHDCQLWRFTFWQRSRYFDVVLDRFDGISDTGYGTGASSLRGAHPTSPGAPREETIRSAVEQTPPRRYSALPRR